MGSGKSTIGKSLASLMLFGFLDLDAYIEAQETMTIQQIFKEKGEIYFRKKESQYLKQILQERKSTPCVISLGGGTPCYANNMCLLKNSTSVMSFYLKSNFKNLAARLWTEKETRPLLSNVQTIYDLEDFIRKHLFERQYYYLQSDHSIDVDTKNSTTIALEIKHLYHEKIS